MTGPRLPEHARRRLRQNINGELMDAILRHRHFLMNVENATIKKLTTPFVRIVSEIEDLLRASFIPDPDRPGRTFNRARLSMIRTRILELLSVSELAATQTMQSDLIKIAEAEAAVQGRILRRVIPSGIELNLMGPDVQRMAAIVGRPLGGLRFADRIRKNYGELASAMQTSLGVSIGLGEGMGPAQRRLRREVADIGVNRATVLARTEIQRVANETAEELYEANGDVLRGMQWVATLDGRTCPVCGSLDGQVFDFQSGPAQRPPAHAQCRCMLAPVVKGVDEIGIDLSRLPAETRASMNGEVAGPISYRDWFDRQPASFQREVLGPARYKLYASGGLGIDSMVQDFRTLRISELPELSTN